MPTETGVRIQIQTVLKKGAPQHLANLLRPLNLPGDLWETTTTSTLTLTPRRRRVDFSSASALGGAVSFVQTPEALVWLQSAAKVHVTIPRERGKEDLAGPRVKGAPDAKPQSKTEFTDANSGQRLRLSITPNPEWRQPELAYPLLAALFAGLNDTFPPGFDVAGLTALLAAEGLPKNFELTARDADGDGAALLSRTTVTALDFIEVDDALFAPPEAYTPWSLQAKEPEGTPEGYTRMLPHQTNADDHPVSRKPHGGGPPDEPGPRPPRPGPTPIPDTTAPRIGLRLEQRLLTHLSQLVNTALTPVRTVTVGQGRIDFDWLNQLRGSVVRRGANTPGTAIFRLLHDVELPAQPATPPPDPASDFSNFHCRGLVDQMALRDAEQRFRDGTYPTILLQALTPATQARIGFAGRDWDLVQNVDKARLAFELLRREYGTLSATFPTSTGSKPILDLLNVSADNIAGTLTLPPVPAPAPNTPPFNPLLTLTAGPFGNITGTLSLGQLDLTATLSRSPTALYWLLLGGGAFAALLVPGLGWVLGILGTLSVFIAADVVNASISVSGLAAMLELRFAPNSQGRLVPFVTCSVTGAISFGWMSVVPTGIHQILAAIEGGIVNALRPTIIQALADAVADAVRKPVNRYLGEGFPASSLHLDLPITGGRVGGSAGVYTYVEAELSSANQLPWAITPVPAPGDLERAQLLDVQRVTTNPPQDHYLSLSLDQNFANVALAAMSMAGRFTGDWRGNVQISQALGGTWPAPLPVRGSISRVVLAPETAPSLQLYSGQAAGQNAHGDLTADYALRFLRPGGVAAAQLRFRITARGQLVLGSAFSPGEGTAFIQIQTLGARAFDLLVQFGGTVTLLGYDLVTTQHVSTTETWFDDNGKPHRQTVTETVETLTAVPLTGPATQALSSLAAAAVQSTLVFRSPTRAPRVDDIFPGAPAGSLPDPVTRLRYPFDESDPDALLVSNNPNLLVHMGLDHALAHYHLNHAGLATLAFTPVISGSPVPLLATLDSSSAAAVLNSVKVRASTTREGFLNL